MSTPARWGLIGFGNIGREIVRQVGQPAVAKRLGLAVEPEFIVGLNGIMAADGQTLSNYKDLGQAAAAVGVVFLAIPSSDDGQAGYDYVTQVLKAGAIAVTAEKGAIANHYAELRSASDGFRRFGITATVGGGTRLLRLAREYAKDIDNITQIHLSLNGTLTAIMDWAAPLQGDKLPLEEAAKRAIQAGYAEPGSDSALSIIRAEAEGDIPKKVAIFYNTVGLGKQLLDWQKLRFSLKDDDIQQALESKTPRRFIVSLYPQSYVNSHGGLLEADILGGFDIEHDGWRLVGGFRRVDANPLFSALAGLTGPGNGMVIGLGPDAEDGIYSVTGPGAGVNPTVNTMLDDYIRLKSL
jgi:homoserine dehydrogenase